MGNQEGAIAHSFIQKLVAMTKKGRDRCSLARAQRRRKNGEAGVVPETTQGRDLFQASNAATEGSQSGEIKQGGSSTGASRPLVWLCLICGKSHAPASRFAAWARCIKQRPFAPRR